MAYNGWTNYETWNVNLWIENDEPLYRAKRRWLMCSDAPVDGASVRLFFDQELNGTTPDFDNIRASGKSLDPINFGEIAEHWEAERQDMRREREARR